MNKYFQVAGVYGLLLHTLCYLIVVNAFRFLPPIELNLKTRASNEARENVEVLYNVY